MIKKLLVINTILIILLIKLPSNKIIKEENLNEIVLNQDVEVKEIEVISRSLVEPRQTLENTEDKSLEGYRVTSYHPGDDCLTGTKTGSGKTTNDFKIININGKSVYTYKGKIVVAGATNELLKSGYNKKGSQEEQVKHYFNYYDTGRIKINDTWYGFIVLDSCGAAMWKGYYRLDIFVPSANDIIDTKNVEIIYD